MSDLSARIRELRVLEKLATGQTVIHRLHPLTKLLSAFVFIVIVASFGRYDFFRLTPYLFYPFVIMALAELPYKLLLSRLLIALPFCLFAGISNIIFDETGAGFLSLLTILLKMYLCVMAALILISTTTLPEITAQLRRLRVPMMLVITLEMTFRYIGVLFEEVFSMITAYKLRSSHKKSVEMRHMGSFAGHLLLRGFDRAGRVHAAMRCRGYSLYRVMPAKQRFKAIDFFVSAAVCLPCVLLRFIVLW